MKKFFILPALLIVAFSIHVSAFHLTGSGGGSGGEEPGFFCGTADICWDATSGLTLTAYTDSDTVTLVNSPTRDSNGLLISSSDEYATIDYTPSSVSSWTIEMVFQSTTTSPDTYAAFVCGPVIADFTLRRNSSNGIQHDLPNEGSGTITGAVSTDYWDEEEHTIRFVMDNSANTVTVYLDGEQDGQDTGVTFGAWTDADGFLVLGNREDEGWEIGGYIKSFKLWESAVTP